MPGKDIDKLFRDGLKNQKPRYSLRYWYGVKARLDKQPKSRPMLYYIAGSVAAFLVVAVAVRFGPEVTGKKDNIALNHSELSKEAASKAINKITVNNYTSPGATSSLIQTNTTRFDSRTSKLSQSTLHSSLHFAGRHINNSVAANPLVGRTIPDNSLSLMPVVEKDIDQTTNKVKQPMSMAKLNNFMPALNTGADEINSTGLVYISPVTSENTSAPHPKIKGNASGWCSINYHFWDNPAYTGKEGKFNFNFNDQYLHIAQTSFSGEQDNYSFEYRNDKIKTSIGAWYSLALAQYDFQSTAGISIAHVFKLGENSSISFGTSGKVLTKKLYYGNIFNDSQIVTSIGFPYYRTSPNDEAVSATHAFAVDAGVWFNHKNFYASLAVQNINKPFFSFVEGARKAIDRQYSITSGYTFNLTNKLSILPRAEIDNTAGIFTGQAQALVSWCGKYMIGIGERNYSIKDHDYDYVVYGGVEIRHKVRIYTSYGRNHDLEILGVHKNTIESGIKVQLP